MMDTQTKNTDINDVSKPTSDFFASKASDYDTSSKRVNNVRMIVQAILDKVELDKSMHLLDFGAGTGLLSAGIAHRVGKITAVDISPAMMAELAKKQLPLAKECQCELEIVAADLTKEEQALQKLADNGFDGIISSMTLHHIQDIPAIFRQFRSLLKAGGFIALADLDSEDGSFHGTSREDVFHHGFNREYLLKTALEAGLTKVQIDTANVMSREGKEYGVFLLVATLAA